MRQEIKLYIGNQEVEFSTPPEILYNYTLTDLHNPTIIKNSYSKTITIEGTPRNNQLFGSIWNLERIQAYGGELNAGVAFNPLQKAVFKIYVNGDLYESGYVKLTNVTKTGRNIEYEINLFGGLGQFFYNLSYTHNEAGEAEGPDKLQLKDLTYVNEGETLEGDDVMDFDFVINKETIFDAWNTLNGNSHAVYSKSQVNRPVNYLFGHKWEDYINFIPDAYNGIPEDFDAEHVLINNPNSFNGAFTSTTESESVTYQTIDGFALGTAPEELTQEATNDYRSYLQRPIIRMSAIIDAIALPENNGGYEVKFGRFFNSNNPYYDQAWMTLPMLKNMKIDKVTDYTITNASLVASGDTAYKVNFTTPTGAELNNFKVTIDVKFNLNSSQSSYPNYLFTNTYFTGDPPIFTTDVNYYKKVSCVMLQMIAFDGTNTPISESNVIMLESSPYEGNDLANDYDAYKDLWNSSLPADMAVPAIEVKYGSFKHGSGTEYYWTNGAVNNGVRGVTFTFPQPMQNFHHLAIKVIHPAWEAWQSRDGLLLWGPKQQYQYSDNEVLGLFSSMRTRTAVGYSLDEVRARDNYKGTYQFGVLDFNAEATAYEGFFSGTKITKDKLLATDDTPASYLIDYCKLFGLFFYRDAAEVSDDPETYPNGVIHILDRAEFYKMVDEDGKKTDPEVINLERYIDRSKPINITPQLPETKWYNFNVEQLQTDAEGKYFSTYEIPYGLKRVNTGYNFDAEATDVYKDNLFRGAPMVSEKNKYFYATEVSSTGASATTWVTYQDNTFKIVREMMNYNAVGDGDEYKIKFNGGQNSASIWAKRGDIISGYGMTYRDGKWYSTIFDGVVAWENGLYLMWQAPTPITSFDAAGKGVSGTKRGSYGFNIIPYYVFNGFKYNLFHGNGGNYDTTELNVSPVTYTKVSFNSAVTGYDLWPRLQLHGDDNKAIDGDGVLVFLNGNVTNHLTYDITHSVNCWITDDIPQMGTLNDGEPCWLMTPSMWNATGGTIAYPMEIFPYFSRMLTNEYTNYNTLSWDFGNPLEVFIPNVYNTDEQGIYARCWRNYITDLYSVNNRRLTCSVLLKEKPNPDWLRRFYWFDNGIWVLNKIKDWSVSTYDSTEMEFVKVQDIKNYDLEDITDKGLIKISFDRDTIDWDNMWAGGKVYSSDGSLWGFDGDYPVSVRYINGWNGSQQGEEITITPMTGSGLTTNFELNFWENQNARPRIFTITLVSGQNKRYYASIMQEGNGDPYVAFYCERSDSTINLRTPQQQKIDIPVYMGGGINSYDFLIYSDMIEKWEYDGDNSRGTLSVWVNENTDIQESARTASVTITGQDGVHPMTYVNTIILYQPSPYISVEAETMTWEYSDLTLRTNEYSGYTSNSEISMYVDDPDEAFVVEKNNFNLRVKPRAVNNGEANHVAYIHLSNGVRTKTITLTQKWDEPATRANVYWPKGMSGNSDRFPITGGTNFQQGWVYTDKGRWFVYTNQTWAIVTKSGGNGFNIRVLRNTAGERQFTCYVKNKNGVTLDSHTYTQGGA